MGCKQSVIRKMPRPDQAERGSEPGAPSGRPCLRLAAPNGRAARRLSWRELTRRSGPTAPTGGRRRGTRSNGASSQSCSVLSSAVLLGRRQVGARCRFPQIRGCQYQRYKRPKWQVGSDRADQDGPRAYVKAVKIDGTPGFVGAGLLSSITETSGGSAAKRRLYEIRLNSGRRRSRLRRPTGDRVITAMSHLVSKRP
jgi:hypothetical protein